MTGAIINAVAILIGGGIGLLLKGRITDTFSNGIMRALGLCVCVIGFSGALGGDVMLMVVSLALGAFLGELGKIDSGVNRLGQWLQEKFVKNEGSSTFAEGFVTATLLFCVGAMAIVGSIDSGLRGDRGIIVTKSILDGVASMIFASTLGVGVLFSAAVVFLYQGIIELFAGALYEVFTPGLIGQISAVGGVMIIGVGLNLVVAAKIKVANLLPAFFVAVGYYILFLRG